MRKRVRPFRYIALPPTSSRNSCDQTCDHVPSLSFPLLSYLFYTSLPFHPFSTLPSCKVAPLNPARISEEHCKLPSIFWGRALVTWHIWSPVKPYCGKSLGFLAPYIVFQKLPFWTEYVGIRARARHTTQNLLMIQYISVLMINLQVYHINQCHWPFAGL